MLETTINGATDVILNVSGDITLPDASDAADFVQSLTGEDINIIFGAMYDESKTDSCTVTVIATGLEDVANSSPVQSRFGSSSVYRSQATHIASSSLKGMNSQPARQENPQPASVQGIHKPVDIRSSVEEKTLKIPDFLQRK